MRKRFGTLLILSLLAGCGGQPTTAQASSGEQTRVYAENCRFLPPIEPPEGAVGAVVDAVVGGVISGTLGRIGKALRAAGEEDADLVVGHYPAEITPGEPAKCVFVAKGNWTTDSSGAWELTPANSDAAEPFKVADQFLHDPDFFLEVAIAPSGGGNALRLVPHYFEYRRLIEDKSDVDDSYSRGIAFEVAVHPPGEGPKSNKAVGAALVLGTMSTGFAYNLRAGTRRALNADQWETGYLPLEYTSAWFPTFAPAPQQATNSSRAASTDSPSGSPSPTTSAGPDDDAESGTKPQTLPRTITVTFTETRAPREVLLFLADVFDASKDEIQTAAELAVLDSKQAEAELAAVKATNTLMSDYIGKLSSAEVKILEYCGVSTADDAAGRTARITASSAANVAQRAANVAALAADQPLPYTSFVPAGDGFPADSGFCD